ncbi:MAG: 6,7-dimethyl-8-ribityllumazine synthase [Deltaproteobacteria bacterium]|jgi:6,7-dimethyl-8-ribityllumazine synthase|nr:6,7-dimethyl-8-ribityllumazine synthase [Deltaproteobacteria bacterium]
MHLILEAQISASGLRLALAVSRFNSLVTERLLEGAVDAFLRHGGAEGDLTVVRVPGAFELPLAVQALARSGRYDAACALGAVIRGSTPHFDYVAAEVSKGLAQVQLATGLPVGFGVLTCDSLEQAADRAGAKSGNKGFDAVCTAIETANLLRLIPARPGPAGLPGLQGI